MRVLVVEDDSGMRGLLVDVLSQYGLEVVAYGDAERAWEACQSQQFPFMVVDWLLPGMDGLELCRRVRELPWGKDPVILVLSARSSPQDLAAILDAGASDFLAKPFDLAALEARLSISQWRVSAAEEHRRAEDALAHLALHDALTDLPNRSLLTDRLEQAILLAQREQSPLALLLMDLDRFKEINDTFGHHVGDRLLEQVGPRLRSAVRASDTIARLGGDEFAVVLPRTDTAGAILAVERLLNAVQEPFEVEGRHLDVGASVGIALFPEHGESAEMLLRCADVAMYIAKRAGGGHAVYAVEQDRYTPERLELIGDLRRAIDGHELELHFQPMVDILSGKVSKVEALARWPHARRGMVPPGEFIPLAEQNGLIDRLSHWVLNAALQQCRQWGRAGLALPVAVNLSMQSLHEPRLPDALAQMLQDAGLQPSLLKLEITESAVMANPARALEALSRVRAIGVEIAIDHFGAGYSSLAYLKRLPVHLLKIDRSFIHDMAVNENDLAIVRATIELSHALGLQVIAEGVEDRATWELLAELGCDQAQGYYLARPMPAEDLGRWLRQGKQA